jgi:hypothetical protein
MVLYQKTIAIELVEMCITFKKHLRRLTRKGGNEHKVFLRKQPSRKTFLGCYSARLAKMELGKTRNLLQHSLIGVSFLLTVYIVIISCVLLLC